MSKDNSEPNVFRMPSRESLNKLAASSARSKHRKTNSTSSNLSIIDLNESNEKDDWSFFTSTQNLASVLNNPNVNRTVSDQIFSRDWGSYFGDHVMKSNSLNTKQIQMRREYIDNFTQNLNSREKFKKNLNESKDFFFEEKRCDKRPNNATTLGQSTTARQPSINLENLIPSIFLQENFKLENLDTFTEILSENENGESLLSNDLSLKANNETIKQTIKDLEKKLTDHLDVVEEHLARQISVRFREFFHIMNAMELVMEQINTTIREVTLVRKNCNRLQETLVYPSLKNIQLTKKKATLQSVYEKIRIMATVHETQPTIQNFLSTYDYVGALDLITATQEVYNQDLNGLTSFRHLNSQLREIRKVIIQMMKEDFVKFLTQEWNRPFTKLELELKNLNFDRVESFNFDKEKLSCMIVGMLKVEYLEFVDTFKEEACTTIQASIKQTVIESLSNEDRIIFKSNLPFEQLNELDFYNWLNVLSQIFDNLYIVLKRIETIHVVIGKTIGKFELSYSRSVSLAAGDQVDGAPSNSLSSDCLKNSLSASQLASDHNRTADQAKQTKENKEMQPFDLNEPDSLNHSTNSSGSGDLNGVTAEKANGVSSTKSELVDQLDKCLFKICQFCHFKCSDIINSKTKDSFFISKVSFEEFSDLVKLIEKFTACNEAICSENIPQLKLALRTQTNRYVTKFHDDHKKSILSLLDIEQWKPFEQINPEFQQMINDLIDYNYSFGEIHKSRKQQVASKSKNASYLKCLEVNGEKFVIVYTVISFVYIVIEYCSIAAEIRSIAPDLLTRLVNLFKQFNSKVMKLVLMAEACQISGLKTITSRHLIVANRCLKLILILLPYVKNHFTSVLLPEKYRPMLKHFDEVKELYVKHIQETIKKVIEVVNDVLVAKINKWEAKPPVPSTEFKEITIHLQRLYSNIQETLPEDELNQLLFQIYVSFTNLLKEQMIKLKIVNDDGPQHL